jgi:dTDP-4-amino-4,6-dideoxygalactose transaminase
MKIPVSKPSLTGNEAKYVNETIITNWISSKGEFVDEFEREWAKYNKVKYGVACSSGTSALVLALKACGVKEGDEVIVPEFTMVATAWAVTYVGAKPVFVDCDDTLNINPDLIKDKITNKTKAIIPVSIYGRKYSRKVLKVIREHRKKIWVIEDLAEAHGTKVRGDIACYSLFGNKIITSGEGGICLTNDKKLAELMKWYGAMCFNESHTFIHPDIGYNFRMTAMQGAVALAQVERFDEIIEKRKQIEKWYNANLPRKVKMPKRDVLWMYDINVGKKQGMVTKLLKERGIETRHFFKPMSQQPMYNYKNYRYTNAFKWAYQGIYLPTYTDMTEEDVIFVCDNLKEVLAMV